jgi:hypothetical protein
MALGELGACGLLIQGKSGVMLLPGFGGALCLIP